MIEAAPQIANGTEKVKRPYRQNYDGKKFTRWTVIRRDSSNSKKVLLECVCECGIKRTVPATGLVSGGSKSCGCLRVDISAKLNRSHGNARVGKITPEFRSWAAMVSRCTSPTNAAWKDYGGRGITVCDRWKDSFEKFLADMGVRPSIKHTLDRRNNDLGYSRDNCRWATKQEQNSNTRRNRMLTANGETHTMSEWARRLNTNPANIHGRLRRGWSEERAVTEPIQKPNICPTH